MSGTSWTPLTINQERCEWREMLHRAATGILSSNTVCCKGMTLQCYVEMAFSAKVLIMAESQGSRPMTGLATPRARTFQLM